MFFGNNGCIWIILIIIILVCCCGDNGFNRFGGCGCGGGFRNDGCCD